jgi:2-dehydropantoate 2-reductase
MKILVAGTGSLACAYAAVLARVPSHQVTMVGRWREQLEAIAAEGITLRGPRGAVETAQVEVCLDPADLAGPYDVAVLATKGYQIADRVQEIRHALGPDTPIFGVQNGLTPWELLGGALDGAGAALAAESMVAATKVGLGEVRLFSLGETLFAPLDPNDAIEPAQLAAAALEAAGMPVRIVGRAELSKLLWQKALIACGLNAVSILLRLPVSAILRSPAAMRVSRAAMEEARDVAATEGIALDVDAAFITSVSFGDNRASGLQDFLAGRPTEISDINGALAVRARAAGIPAPANKLLAELVAALYETAVDRIPETDAMREPALAQRGGAL